jgi:antitoxin component YwqK of YwqJK toxin-antitoxin module
MNKDKNIIPRNNKGQQHGYCELYWDDGHLWYKRFFHNGKEIGYEETYWHSGKLLRKKYHI